MTVQQHASGGRPDVRRSVVWAAAVLAMLVSARQGSAADHPAPQQTVTVREERGVYFVVARFQVRQPSAVVRTVLTDYDRIPRFMPGIKRSVVLERAPGRVLIEQEAISRFMMFSKRVHLVLEITEGADTLAFKDQCRHSFLHYEGSWHISEGNGFTDIHYELTAQPAFDVPEVLLKRLLKRDSGEMIEGLRREIAARATSAAQLGSTGSEEYVPPGRED